MAKDLKKKENMQQERNIIITEIHRKLEQEEIENILKQIEEIEQYKDDSRHMFHVVKQIQKRKGKNRIEVGGEDRVTAEEGNQ